MKCRDCHKDIDSKHHGHRSCKSCHDIRYSIPAYQRRLKQNEAKSSRHCPRCEKTKACDEFYTSGSYCKPCFKLYRAERKIKTEGMIYAIAEPGGEYVKIGYATDVAARFCDIQVGNPRKLTLLASWPGTRKDEKEIHRRHHSQRVSGEWFLMTPEIVELIAAQGAINQAIA